MKIYTAIVKDELTRLKVIQEKNEKLVRSEAQQKNIKLWISALTAQIKKAKAVHINEFPNVQALYIKDNKLTQSTYEFKYLAEFDDYIHHGKLSARFIKRREIFDDKQLYTLVTKGLDNDEDIVGKRRYQ